MVLEIGWREPRVVQFTLYLTVLNCEMDPVLVAVVHMLHGQTSLKSSTRRQPKSSGWKAESAPEILCMSRVREMVPRIATEQKISVAAWGGQELLKLVGGERWQKQINRKQDLAGRYSPLKQSIRD